MSLIKTALVYQILYAIRPTLIIGYHWPSLQGTDFIQLQESQAAKDLRANQVEPFNSGSYTLHWA